MAGCCLCYENAWKTWPFCVDSRLGTNCKSATHNPRIQRFKLPAHFQGSYFGKPLTTCFQWCIAYLTHETRGREAPEGECSKCNTPLTACSNYYVLHFLFSCHLLSYIFTMQSTLDAVDTACIYAYNGCAYHRIHTRKLCQGLLVILAKSSAISIHYRQLSC